MEISKVLNVCLCWSILYYFGLCRHLVSAWATELLYCCSENSSGCWPKWSRATGEMQPKKSDSGLSNYPSPGIERFFVILHKELKMVKQNYRRRFQNPFPSVHCRTRLPRALLLLLGWGSLLSNQETSLLAYMNSGLPQFELLSSCSYWFQKSITVLQSENLMCTIRKLPL